MDRLAAMQSFVRAVDLGSFAAAAAELGLSPGMVGNHVRYLEARLGAQLLNRTTRRQSVTAVGRVYHPRSRRVLDDIEDAEKAAEASNATPRGLLRITAPLTLAATVLPGVIAAYLRRHPEVRVDLVVQDRRLDLLADELDLAFRVGALPDSTLMARALPPLRLVACASPSYLRARGHPRTPADLRSHNCLDFAFAGEPFLWRFSTPSHEMAVPIGGTLRSDNGQVLRAAALEHVGVILQPEVLVADDLASGRLIRLLPDHETPSLPLHLLTLPDRFPSPRVRSFVDLATEVFGVSGPRKAVGAPRGPASADGEGAG